MELSSDTTNLFRPNQVEEAREELQRMSSVLDAPPHIRGKVSDVRGMQQRRKRLAADLEKYTPKAFRADEKDAAVSEFKRLAAEIEVGMPSSMEMRRNMPGAVSKHIGWEKRNKTKINRWKHLGLRLAAGGDVRGDLAESADVVNVELLRKLESSHDLSKDGAQIPQATNYHFGADPVGTVLFTAAEEALLKDVNPEISGSLAVLDNETRAKIKELLAGAVGVPAATEVPADVMTDKPEMSELNFQAMQQLAKKNGMNTRAQSKSSIASWLRAHRIIR